MVKHKRTTDSQSLNFFKESVVKILSASVNYHTNGRSTLVRTMQTADGQQHTFTVSISPELALKHIREIWTQHEQASDSSSV